MNLREKLSTEIIWKNFNVNSNTNYIISGIIENINESFAKSSIIIFNFQNEKLSSYEIEFNRLNVSKKFGYYKYLPNDEGQNIVNFLIKIPKNVKNISIGLVQLNDIDNIFVENINLINNFVANEYMKKHYSVSKSNSENYEKRVIFRNRWFKEKQYNLIIKNRFSYKFSLLLINSFRSTKNFISSPILFSKLLYDFFKYKDGKLKLEKWYELTDKYLYFNIKLEKNNTINIKGNVFTLAEEKSNSIVICYSFPHEVDIEEMKKAGFSYSEKIGYYNYLNTSTEGEYSFEKKLTFPSLIKNVTISFRTWHNKKTILLKINSIGLFKSSYKRRNDIQKESLIFSDTLSKKETFSLIGWQKYSNPNNKPVVMAVMDEFTTGCFEDEVCLIQPRPDNWLALIKTYKPDLVFIESAWKGNYGSWQYRVADYSNKPGDEIEQISQYCKQKNIPMIFWNKEDPVHHQKFMCSAKLATHIFTTDSNMIESYKKNTNCKKVFALPFAAQPTLHKPKSLKDRINKSCFAGSWYGNRHAERGEAMKWLLEAANEYGLDIFDRNFGTGVFPFPEQYQDGIKGSLPYKELCEEYSKYRIFLNVNSVTDSPTMFSRRVFELMACGTPIVSTYAKGIEELFDTDAVWLVHTKEEALHAIKTLMTDQKEWRRRSLLGIREVFSKHTYSHRLNYIFKSAGLNSQINIEPKIVLLARVNSEMELAQLNEFIESQSYKNIILYVEYSLNNIKSNLILKENINLCKNLKEEIGKAKDYKAIGWIDTDINYGSYYIQDLVNATTYEPTANGWAKSIDDDHFDYNKTTLLSASTWKSEIFVNQYFEIEIQNSVIDEKLFVIDSDEYTNQKNQGVAK